MRIDYRSLTDADLIALLKEDNEFAFREIYARFHDFLYLYAFQLTSGDEQESQDILQNLFLNLWNRRMDLIIEKNLLHYLHQGVRFGFLNSERSKNYSSKYKEDLLNYINKYGCATDDYIFEKELVKRLKSLASTIPGKGGEVFLLYYFENYSHSEISASLGISEKTVKNILSKSTKEIRLKINPTLWMLYCMHSLL